MKNLWLPTDHLWKFRIYPIKPMPVKPTTKAEIIETIFSFPDTDILPDTDNQQQLLENLQAHFKLVSTWLHYRLLGRLDYHDRLYSDEDALRAKPYADLSVATLEFCAHVFPRLRPPGVDNFEELWGIIEYSKSQAVLTASGYYGNPLKRPDGKIATKRDREKSTSEAIHGYKELLDFGMVSTPLIKDFVRRESILEIVLKQAIDFADENDDFDLHFQIKKYLREIAHHNRTVFRSGECLILPSLDGDLFTTHRGGKGFKPPEEKHKRGRGRPLLGSERK